MKPIRVINGGSAGTMPLVGSMATSRGGRRRKFCSDKCRSKFHYWKNSPENSYLYDAIVINCKPFAINGNLKKVIEIACKEIIWHIRRK